jgi:hypothetical protein
MNSSLSLNCKAFTIQINDLFSGFCHRCLPTQEMEADAKPVDVAQSKNGSTYFRTRPRSDLHRHSQARTQVMFIVPKS